jgi:Antibiotic biosynthesis monooxygenase
LSSLTSGTLARMPASLTLPRSGVIGLICSQGIHVLPSRTSAGRGILGASPHCLGWELRRSVEEPGHYVVRIEWDSLAGHVRGFRESAPFRAFFGELSVFAEFRQEMEHFELVRNQLSIAED